MKVVSGDIGGTNTRLQLTEFSKNHEKKVISSSCYVNQNYSSLNEIIDNFLVNTSFALPEISSVCFGVAGPLVDQEVKFTNLPWVVKTSELKDKFQMDSVALINDFVAIGYGLETLDSSDLMTLQSGGYIKNGVKVYIGAGTGLGVGFMVSQAGKYTVYPTEGGHIDFAPSNNIQIELLKFLQKRYARVSLERLLSGDGLINIYKFVREINKQNEQENLELKKIIDGEKHSGIARAITEYALKYNDQIAKKALDIFIDIYGAAVGNLALTALPYGGLYLVGGITPKIINQIKGGRFIRNFRDKGRLSDLLKDIPLHVVLTPDVGLQGATLYAKKIFC